MTQEIVDAARKEGALTFYGPANQDAYDAIFAEFMKDYPEIKVTATSMDNAAVTERVLTEVKTNHVQADAVQGVSELIELQKGGALVDYTVPAAKERSAYEIPAGMPIVPDAVLTKFLVFNTKLMTKDEAPKTWEELTDPKWKGKLALEATDFEWFSAMKATMGPDKAKDFFDKLSKNVVVRKGSSATVNLLIAGEFPIFIDAFGHNTVLNQKKGAPLEFAQPQPEPIVVAPSYWAVIKNSPHPNAAKLMMNWIISDRGQEAEAKAGRIPVLKNSQFNPVAPLLEGKKLYTVLPGSIDYAAVGKEFNQYFTGQ